MRNVIVLTLSTIIYVLIFVSGIGRWIGNMNLPLSLFIFSVVIPFVFGYFTQKYLTSKAMWTPMTTLVIPVIPSVTELIFNQIKTGWRPMDVPLSATLGFIILQAVFVVFGAYVYTRWNETSQQNLEAN